MSIQPSISNVKELLETLTMQRRITLVYFTANWSGTCSMMDPVVASVLRRFSGRMESLRIDVETDPAFIPFFRLPEIPAILLFREGELIGCTHGLVSRGHLNLKVEKVLGIQPKPP